MSRIFLILLIALLPLREWSAGRMAVYMAASETTAIAMAAEDQAMPADCPMTVKADSSEDGAGHGNSKGERSCQSCQLCMSLAALETQPIKSLSYKPLTAAIPRADRFASADLVRAAKPPIS
ncbi:MAG: hypothetical protein H7Y28_14270 [Rhodoferax sp.]|nr:hypothetical protein [Rhodoferax sp.]